MHTYDNVICPERHRVVRFVMDVLAASLNSCEVKGPQGLKDRILRLTRMTCIVSVLLIPVRCIFESTNLPDMRAEYTFIQNIV